MHIFMPSTYSHTSITYVHICMYTYERSGSSYIGSILSCGEGGLQAAVGLTASFFLLYRSNENKSKALKQTTHIRNSMINTGQNKT